jgi:hypothetical protein
MIFHNANQRRVRPFPVQAEFGIAGLVYPANGPAPGPAVIVGRKRGLS